VSNFFRALGKILPTLLIAFLLALAVWALAVIATDPTQTLPLPDPIAITITSQDPSLAITNTLPRDTTIVLKAPKSVWAKINADPESVQALLDLSALQPGEHQVPVKIQIGYHPSELVSSSVSEVTISLEKIESKVLPIGYVPVGNPAPGYSFGSVSLTPNQASVSGPSSRVAMLKGLQASLQMNNSAESVAQEVPILPLDGAGDVVSGVKVVPEFVQVVQNVEQRGGYRTVVVKVPFTGQLANGYRLGSVTVNPPVLTVFSDDPQLVENLPGYIETLPVDLTGINADQDIRAVLNMPQGIQMDGEKSVLVKLGVSALEGSLTFSNQAVEITGLGTGYSARVSPTRVDVIISGPLPILNKLTAKDVHVIMDLTGMTSGNYQKKPEAMISVDGLKVDSILPVTLEVVITLAGTPTP
jgi:YbbR domain-containing protein